MVELRYEGKKVEDLSKPTLVKMLKELYIHARNLEFQLKQRKQDHPDTKIIVNGRT